MSNRGNLFDALRTHEGIENIKIGDDDVDAANFPADAAGRINIGAAQSEESTPSSYSIYIGSDMEYDPKEYASDVIIGGDIEYTQNDWYDSSVVVGGDSVVDSSAVVSVGNFSTIEGGSEDYGQVNLGYFTESEDSDRAIVIGSEASATDAPKSVTIGAEEEATNEGEGVIGVDQLRFGAVGGTISDDDLGDEEVTFSIDEDEESVVVTLKNSDSDVSDVLITEVDSISPSTVDTRPDASGDGAIAIGDGVEATNDGEGAIGVDQLRFGAVDGTIGDGDLEDEEITFAIDTDNEDVIIRLRDSNGDIQTASVSFD